MKYVLPVLVFSVMTIAAAVYLTRGTSAQPNEQERPSVVGSVVRPQVSGRLTIWIDGDQGEMICEYDALVEVRGGKVTDILPSLSGVVATKSGTVKRGEAVATKDTGWRGVAVYRDEAGKLQTGCATESVRIGNPPDPNPPLDTPDPETD